MDSNIPMKKVQVLPNTWIMIPADADETEAKERWLKKFNKSYRLLDEQQKRRERTILRENRVMQRTKYKY